MVQTLVIVVLQVDYFTKQVVATWMKYSSWGSGVIQINLLSTQPQSSQG